jgi:prepilin-type N-terminal cleavage/methylation domain-containing protein
MLKNYKKGFTLIELLVVIAIIGILSSVVLASLNSARSKGADAAVKSGMKQIQAQAELYYSDNNAYSNGTGIPIGLQQAICSFSGSFLSDPKIQLIMQNIASNAGSGSYFRCYLPNVSTYEISITPLKGGGSWCIDSTGKSKAGIANGTDNGVCP